MASLLESSQVFNNSSGSSKWRGLPILQPRWRLAHRPSGEAFTAKVSPGRCHLAYDRAVPDDFSNPAWLLSKAAGLRIPLVLGFWSRERMTRQRRLDALVQ